MYIGILAIPEHKWSDALGDLEADRLPDPKCNYPGYDGEIHCASLTRRQKAELAKRWLNTVLWDREKRFHFYVLGLSLDRLQPAAFGGAGRHQRVYNRFFRSAVAYTLRSYFAGNQSVAVASIFHDQTHMENDPLFDWHTIWRLDEEYPDVTFADSRIRFIDSDHRKEKAAPAHSHFIQLIDLILGATRQCLDCTSEKQYMTEAAKTIMPLVERLTDNETRSNPNSRYQHFKRCSIAFFPSAKLTLDQLADPWERVSSTFFYQRPLSLRDRLSGQGRLDLG
jgi:hypothetical protein